MPTDNNPIPASGAQTLHSYLPTPTPIIPNVAAGRYVPTPANFPVTPAPILNYASGGNVPGPMRSFVPVSTSKGLLSIDEVLKKY